jgi:DNA-binding transcriptional LysR family regulator
VLAGDLELGVLTLPLSARDLDTEVLTSDEIVLVARSDHPLAHGHELEVGDLDGLPFVAFEPGTAIRQHIDTALRDAAVHIDVVMELRSIPTILRMVSVTGYLAFVSRVSVATEPGLRVLEMRGLSIVRTLALARRRDLPLSAPAAAFRAELLAVGA